MADESKSGSFEPNPEVAEALLCWFQSFNHISKRCETIEDLSDGVVCYEVMSHIAPVYFDVDTLTGDEGSSLLAVSNMKRLLSDLEAYYSEGLGLAVERVTELDAEAIASSKDKGQLQRLAELVLGAAALCEDNADYVRTIMEMEPQQQRCLVPIIEHAMTANQNADSRDLRSDSFQSMASDEFDDAGSQASGAASTPRSPTHRASADRRVLALEIENQNLSDEKEELQAKIDLLVAEARGAASANDDAAAALEREQRAREREEQRVLELLQEVKAKDSELSKLAKSSEKRIDELEAELRQRTDEQGVLRRQVNELSQSAAAFKKAKQRLEAVGDLKRVNKELEASNREYLSKIVGLEDAVKAAESRAQSYRDQLTEAQSGKLDVERVVAECKSEMAKLTASLERESEARHFAEQQLASVRRQVSVDDGDASDDSDEGGMFERVTPAMRERMTRLEIENEKAKSAAAEAETLRGQVSSLQEQLASVKEALSTMTAKHAALENARSRQPQPQSPPPRPSAETLAKLEAAQTALEAKAQELSQAQGELTRVRGENKQVKDRVRAVLAKFKRDKAKRQEELEATKAAYSECKQELAKEQARANAAATTASNAERRRAAAEKRCEQAGALKKRADQECAKFKKRWENTEKRLAIAERQMKAQSREDGVMAAAFYKLGLVNLSDDVLETPDGWLKEARRRRRDARSPLKR